MNIQRYAKKEIACNQIETALSLLFAEADLFSVITLAGAAEEILGQLLRQTGGNTGLGGSVGAVLEILRPGNRNGPKDRRHSGHETDAFVHLDPYQEALFLLGRAIDDYQMLSGTLSCGMLRFNAELRAKIP